jgi:hypothetical protein
MAEEITEQTDEEIIAIAEPIVQNMLESSYALDYERFTRDISEHYKKAVPENKFHEETTKLIGSDGQCVARKLLGVLRKGEAALVVWSAKYDKTEDDTLIQLMITREGERYLVIWGLWS